MDSEHKYFGFVYLTTNLLNNKKYIGKCVFGRKNGWRNYLGSGVLLQEDIKKYGKDNFSREILFLALDNQELEEIEEFLIKTENAVKRDDCYNIKDRAIGGDIFTGNPNKEKIRQMRKNQMSGSNNHQYKKPKTQKMINSVKEANSKKIIIDGVMYNSIKEASEKLNIKETTICYRLKSNSFKNYQYLK